MPESSAWQPDSWRALPILQQPAYTDPTAVEAALAQVRALPPLVASGEVSRLRDHLARVSRGEAFLLQGGDCAERFDECARDPIERKLKILLQMSLVLTWGTRLPVVRVGRIAGQYAKPRSKPTEIIDGQEVHSYRGDHVNGHDPSDRVPEPARLVEATYRSAATLNYVRALIDGGFADLHNPRHWDLGFVRNAARRHRYEEIVDRILDALDFVEATGVQGRAALRSVEIYTSHEGLLLPYETAHTVQEADGYYNLGAHMLWVGNRTRQIDGAHIEYFRGIENPIGIKVGPGLAPADLIALLDQVEPEDRPGRVTVISRFGADRVKVGLPPLIQAVRATGRSVVWSCDPMHGNTTTTDGGIKTRDVGQVFLEVQQAIEVHEKAGGFLGGVHFELTGDNVTECVGGPEELREADLGRRYQSFCDPRLNYAQSLEMAFLLAGGLSQKKRG
jgi:3-deoxy-7-phosphoheptulonate synthase